MVERAQALGGDVDDGLRASGPRGRARRTAATTRERIADLIGDFLGRRLP